MITLIRKYQGYLKPTKFLINGITHIATWRNFILTVKGLHVNVLNESGKSVYSFHTAHEVKTIDIKDFIIAIATDHDLFLINFITGRLMIIRNDSNVKIISDKLVVIFRKPSYLLFYFLTQNIHISYSLSHVKKYETK